MTGRSGFLRVGHTPTLIAALLYFDTVITAVRRPHHGAALEIDLPGVQRAHHRGTGHDAVAERPALMWALRIGGKKPVAEIEQRQFAAADQHRPAFAGRDVVHRRHAYPSSVAHASTVSIARIGVNCAGVLGVCPSSHASLARAFDFASRSSSALRTVSGAYTVSLRTFSIPSRSTKS